MFRGIKYHSVDVQGLNQRQLEVLAKGAQDALLQHLADHWARHRVSKVAKRLFYDDKVDGPRLLWDHIVGSYDIINKAVREDRDIYLVLLEDADNIYKHLDDTTHVQTIRDLRGLWEMLNNVVIASQIGSRFDTPVTFESLAIRAYNFRHTKEVDELKRTTADPLPELTAGREAEEERRREEEDYD